jgi:sulfate adenylyltransferase (ADP) / ATP adenylyltransferase
LEGFAIMVMDTLLVPGTLWLRTLEQTRRAWRTGTLHSLPARSFRLTQNGLRFIVRVLDRSHRLPPPDHEPAAPDPFDPPESELLIGPLTDTHLCVLNKYNVLDHHLLLVTRQPVDQEMLLDSDDFTALWRGLQECPGLGFYNGGAAAGASQRHKHLQLIPCDPIILFPLASLITAVARRRKLGSTRRLPFRHTIVRVDLTIDATPVTAARYLMERYRALLAAAGLPVIAGSSCQPAPYNLLMTREWLLLVPRTTAECEGIAVNALGFVGALLARNEVELQRLRAIGPLTLLSRVSLPASAL